MKEKIKGRLILQYQENEDEQINIIIPTVMYSEPKIKIYDYTNDGSFWFREIGFNRKINEE